MYQTGISRKTSSETRLVFIKLVFSKILSCNVFPVFKLYRNDILNTNNVHIFYKHVPHLEEMCKLYECYNAGHLR